MPDHPLQRAMTLHRSGKIAEAQALYRGVLKKDPKNFDGLYRLGISFAQQGKFDHAIAWIRKALAVRPDFAQGHFDLGSLYGQSGRFGLAVKSLEQAVACKPDYAEAYHNLGNAQSELGRSDDALAALDRAIELAPGVASAHFNRGNVHKAGRRYEAAVADYDKALEIDPGHVRALNNLGNCLYEQGRNEPALEAFRRALALKPDYVHAWFNLADLQRRLGRWEEAAASLERVVALDPDYPFGLGGLVTIRMHCCDWTAVEMHLPRVVEGVRAGKPTMDPFSFMGVSDGAADQLACARTWVDHDCPPMPAIWRGERYRHDKIRVAYVSADFHHHPMAFLMSGVFEHHDRARFELSAVAFDADETTPIRQRMKDAFDHFIDARDMSDEDVARRLRALEIDIAIDRKGFTRDARTGVFARRPAPLQINYLAYPGTMGAGYIDYILADRFVIPQGQEKHYSEKVVRLPDSYQANDSRRPIAEETPSRAQAGLPDTGFVFCSFNANYKINRPVFDVWMGLLREVEDSVLWLYEGNPVAVRNLRAAAVERGIAPARIVFAAHMVNPSHLARVRLADLCLDTLPYGAHTTASDSLYAGVPIVTCRGHGFAGRVTMGLLHACGLPELAAETLDDYRALALKCARDRDFHRALKAKLAGNIRTEALFDTARFTRHIEAAYETMWERSRKGLPPRAFDVPAGA